MALPSAWNQTRAMPSEAQTSRTERRREQILHAAYRVFADKGYAQTTIADVAAELKIGHGTFYRYFNNKHAIFEYVVQQVITRVSGALAGEEPTGANDLEAYRKQVQRIAWKLLSLLDEDPRASKLLFVEAVGVSDRLDRMLDDLFQLLAKITEAYLVNGKTKGFLRQNLDTELTALAINNLILAGGRFVLRADSRGQGEAARERYVSAIVTLMFDGIRA